MRIPLRPLKPKIVEITIDDNTIDDAEDCSTLRMAKGLMAHPTFSKVISEMIAEFRANQ